MIEIVGEQVTKVWFYGKQKYGGRDDIVGKHLAAWILALNSRSVNGPLPPVELIWEGDRVVGVRANV
jgi:hypothetical protein